MERKEIISVVMIGVLLVTVALQTIQLVSLSEAQVVVPATPSTSSARAPLGSGTAQPPSSGATNLADIPSMVGGC